ncbi:MAG: type II toxin-antitoxin system PemK/MazF family toxin [Gemmatimonadaceae bacterium]
MEIARSEVWWADLGEPRGSAPGYRRPVLIVQADAFNRSRIQTVVAVALTSNLRLVAAPGNVLVPAAVAGLPKDSVANVSQIVTLDRDDLTERSGRLPARVMRAVDDGLRFVLGL